MHLPALAAGGGSDVEIALESGSESEAPKAKPRKGKAAAGKAAKVLIFLDPNPRNL